MAYFFLMQAYRKDIINKIPKDVKCSGEKAYKEGDIEIWYNATYVAID